MTEVWKDVKGYEGYYQISNLGRVKSIARHIVRRDGRSYFAPSVILEPFQGNTCNYLSVQFSKNNITQKFMIHRLVAQAFLNLDLSSDFEVNHKNGDKHNNAVANLEIVTHQQNINHSVITNLKHDYGEQSTNAKLSNQDAQDIRKQWRNGVKQIILAEIYHVSKQTINNIVHNKTYFK